MEDQKMSGWWWKRSVPARLWAVPVGPIAATGLVAMAAAVPASMTYAQDAAHGANHGAVIVAIPLAMPAGPIDIPDLRFCLAPVTVYNGLNDQIDELRIGIRFNGGANSFSWFTDLKPMTSQTDFGVHIPHSNCAGMAGTVTLMACRRNDLADCGDTVLIVPAGAVPLAR
jgi:hypothetical protein